MSGAFTLSVERYPDPAVTANRPIIRQRSDGGLDLSILRFLVSPSRATPFAKTRVELRARGSGCFGYRIHNEPSSGKHGKHEISVFLSDF